MGESFKVVISDTHIGEGVYLENGQLNSLENFTRDGKLVELLTTYDADKIGADEVEFVANGDFLDLLQVPVDGGFPDKLEAAFVIAQLDKVYRGHLGLFKFIAKWLKNPKHKFRYIVGNHDMGLALAEAHRYFFTKLLEIDPERYTEYNKFRYIGDNFHIEHGQQGESLWHVDEENAAQIIDAPWGYYWITHLLNPVKQDCPYLDVVRPIPAWIFRTLFSKPIWLTGLGLKISWFVIYNALFNKNMSVKSKFRPTYSILRKSVGQSTLEGRAEMILREMSEAIEAKSEGLVVLAHNHKAGYKRIPDLGEYFNSGTWCSIVSLYTESIGTRRQLNYILMRKKDEPGAVWHGQLRLWHGTPVIDELVLPA